MIKKNKTSCFSGKIVIVGFGSIGQGVLPLILRHIDIPKKNISIITADRGGESVAKKEGIRFLVKPLTSKNYRAVLNLAVAQGDFLLNLSVEVSSIELIKFCRERGILYLDTCIEPWAGGYSDPRLTLSERSNYGIRETALKLKNADGGDRGPTAVVAHGANPGIVSHFIKRALLHIAKDTGLRVAKPKNKNDWGMLAKNLNVKTIHIAEYDTQISNKAKKIGRFENTWSVEGFHSEGVLQPSELGWGTHEKHFPADGKRHDFGCGAGIYLLRPGGKTLVRTWTPLRKHFLGRVVTHNESISIADFFTLKKGNKTIYRPTVHYAYRPCDVAVLSLEEVFGNNSELQKEQRILMDEIVEGMDELGVLVMGHKKSAYWYGSQLTIEKTRKLAPYQNATGLQVTAGVLAGIIWAMENPERGIVEADDIDFERAMEIIEPYMGKMVGEYTNWTPLKGREGLFPEDIDHSDPWQFKNFRVK